MSIFEFSMDVPESRGIRRSAISEFEQKLQERGIPMHGYLLLSGKNILAEKYYAPYEQNSLHRMYSITKSFTSLAVGLLARDGKIDLDDRICTYFQDKYEPGKLHPWCEELTIREMLSMQTCYAKTTYKQYDDDDWTKSFFRVTPDHRAGTVFSYDTSSSQTLAALVERLSGKPMLDYLREQALDELGFGSEAYILTDGVGVSQGGSGLMCTLRDVARVAYACNHYGVVDGKELFPRDYMKSAISQQVPTALQPAIEEQQGYGYMFWRLRKNGFVMYGMGGQLAMCFPDLDFCMLTIADTIGIPAGLQILYDSFYDTIYKELHGAEGYAPRTIERKSSEHEAERQHTYEFCENPMGFRTVNFDWQQDKVTLTDQSGAVREFSFGRKRQVAQKYPGTNYTCQNVGYWEQDHFILKCYVTDEEQGHVRMEFAWKGPSVTVRWESTNEPFFASYKNFATAYLPGEH